MPPRADAADPQNYKLCEKLGLSVIVSEGPHLTTTDWLKMSDEEIDNYIKAEVGLAPSQPKSNNSKSDSPSISIGVASNRNSQTKLLANIVLVIYSKIDQEI